MSVTLDILGVGARGDGIAELDGQRYFVPFTLPGETVEARPRDKRGEGIATDLLDVLAPSRHREAPPCAHFKVCGGCALQHWRRDAYAAWKVELIACPTALATVSICPSTSPGEICSRRLRMKSCWRATRTKSESVWR